ncbi:chemotaxis response regulator protein-glutamate methylesterase [Microvirga sp. CF3062]|uniref:protein-glutamate methylesterase/protein-glutamine glutaminase n=1 Tax=Microvirga sp. CF3062 TaxID=3110182 RepID=UPI002E75F7CA|nr:chemotaxis response regulator protein-glutamate methylesterase [Microvirga sp. CF3062]MEE1655394.1 chemotaxis response regulator protein-glutamate methylesterase [Microvirga sp. CF3062]
MSIAPVIQPGPAQSRPTRVMIVDDSAVIRGMIARWLTEAGGFEIVATASNGRIAVDAAERSKPEIILLDIEMPEVDGLAALPMILKAHPTSKVIVISTLTQRNAEISLKCLSLGAVDYLAKPESARAAGAAADFQRDLIAKLRALGEAKSRQTRSSAPALSVLPTPSASPAARPGTVKPQCLLIGSSTGGPRAVERVLLDLKPALSSIPVLIVQHMPAMFTAVFAEHLQSFLSVPAREARDGDIVSPGTILVAPGGRHMGVVSSGGRAVIRLNDGPPENFCRPAVDVLFRDAAGVFGASALAAVLTGMGSDGTHGARHLTKAGATVIAQDEATSIVWGMPGSIVKAGLAHEVLPLESIGRSLKGHITGCSK